ncbi:MAG: phosphocholine cytidylyltransferase family protein [Lachnospiraceae bacterium]|nr:phosphocholine cytidylyltransferase family protein [Lachnospiraceae bacterium]
MKAIILAAGQGTRLKKYTKNLPKGMLSFMGKTIIERQIELYRKCGITKIIVVTGFAAHTINYPDIVFYHNEDYAQTNMVTSFMKAKEEFDEEIIVSYSDILVEEAMLRSMLKVPFDFSVAVDDGWKTYWQKRYGKIEFDTESLSIDAYDNITELGLENPDLEKIDARYIGLLKFSPKGLAYLEQLFCKACVEYGDKPWQQSGKSVKQAYMTDLLNAIIESGQKVKAVRFQHGWIEFDTNEDYEKACGWVEDGSIEDLLHL